MASDRDALEGLMQALTRNGYTVSDGPDLRRNPCTLRVDGKALRIYSRPLTGPQKGRRLDERHMQMTFDGCVRGSQCYLQINDDHVTLLLGFSSECQGGRVYAAFDPVLHTPFRFSDSLQVSMSKIEEAVLSGMAFASRRLRSRAVETVILFHETMFHRYLDLHADFGALTADDVKLINEQVAEDDANVPRERQAIRRTQLARDRGFRARVLSAYSGCAVCGLQMQGLLDGAHIVPVTASNSDRVNNGLALCSLCHSMFDAGLVLVDETGNIELSPHLQTPDRERLETWVGTRLRFPASPEHYPHPANLRRRYQQQRNAN